MAATSFLVAATATAGLVGIPLGLQFAWWALLRLVNAVRRQQRAFSSTAVG